MKSISVISCFFKDLGKDKHDRPISASSNVNSVIIADKDARRKHRPIELAYSLRKLLATDL